MAMLILVAIDADLFELRERDDEICDVRRPGTGEIAPTAPESITRLQD